MDDSEAHEDPRYQLPAAILATLVETARQPRTASWCILDPWSTPSAQCTAAVDIAHVEAKLNHTFGSPALVERALRSPHVGYSLGHALVEAVLGEVNLCGPEDISAATRRHLACCSHV